MTPAINELEKAKADYRIHRFDSDPGSEGYALAAASQLGVPAETVFKTLMATDGKQFAVAIVPADRMLSLKAIAKAAGWKKAKMAAPEDAQRLTGYLVGGISPLGQKKRLPRFLDQSAQGFEMILVSGGQRGLDLELTPQTLIDCGIQWASLADD